MLGIAGMGEAKVLFWKQIPEVHSSQNTANYGTS